MKDPFITKTRKHEKIESFRVFVIGFIFGFSLDPRDPWPLES